MNSAIRFIPNLLTLLNLTMGVLGIIFAAREHMIWSVYCVAIALLADFLDGFVARLLNAHSALGKQLDSLADLVTFGVLPGFILFQMIAVNQGVYFMDLTQWTTLDLLHCSLAILVPMGAALRLGIFNLDETKRDHFLGMPSPAMALYVIAIPLVLEANYHLNFYNPLNEAMILLVSDAQHWDTSDQVIVSLLFEKVFYQVLAAALAILMLVRIPMISLKFKGISWRENKWRYALIIWAVVAYLLFVIPYIHWLPFSYGLIDYLILPIFMIGYFILSVIYAIFGASNKRTIPVR